jgi:putative endonuclease
LIGGRERTTSVCHAELVEASLSFHTIVVRDYYVYILASASGVLYIGVTNDLTRRVFEHREKLVPGFTGRYNVTRLVYFEWFAGIHDAIAREKQLKGWRREKKLELIKKTNPQWNDLSRLWGYNRDPSTSSG